MDEPLETQHVDGDVAIAQVVDDAFVTVVERRGDDDDLVTQVERLFVEVVTQSLKDVLGQAIGRREVAVDGGDVLGPESFVPAGVIERLRHDLARRAIALEFD